MAVKRTPKEQVGRFYELRDQLPEQRKSAYQLTEDITVPVMTRRIAREFDAAETSEDKLKVLLGDQYDAIIELYDDRPIAEWRAFQEDLYEHLFGKGSSQLPGGSEGS